MKDNDGIVDKDKTKRSLDSSKVSSARELIAEKEPGCIDCGR